MGSLLEWGATVNLNSLNAGWAANKLFSEENKEPELCLKLERWQGPPHINDPWTSSGALCVLFLFSFLENETKLKNRSLSEGLFKQTSLVEYETSDKLQISSVCTRSGQEHSCLSSGPKKQQSCCGWMQTQSKAPLCFWCWAAAGGAQVYWT